MSGSDKVIAFVVRNNSFGGINSVTAEIAAEINRKQGYSSIVLILSRTEVNESVFKECNVIYLSGFLNGVLGFINKLLNKLVPLSGGYILSRFFEEKLFSTILKLNGVEKIFLCGFGAYSFFVRCEDKRVYFISHSIKSKMLKQRNKFTYKLSFSLLKVVAKSKRIVAISDAIKNDWINNIGINSDSICRRIYNPLNAERIKYLSMDFGGINDDYFLFCGRLSKEKNIITIIDGYIESGVKEKLFLLGDGPDKFMIESYLAKKKIEHKVKLLGSRENPYPILKSAKALILMSHFEGLPTVALEAISLSINLIVGECGGAAYDLIDNDEFSKILKSTDREGYINSLREISRGGVIKFKLKDDFKPYNVALEYLET